MMEGPFRSKFIQKQTRYLAAVSIVLTKNQNNNPYNAKVLKCRHDTDNNLKIKKKIKPKYNYTFICISRRNLQSTTTTI